MKQIIQQDCLAWMRTQPDDSIDTIITSPPYNKKGLRGGVRTSTSVWSKANIDYGVYADEMPEDEYQAWQIEVVNECHRILKPTGSIFYQHKIRNWDRKGSHPMEWLAKTQAQFYQEIVWNRSSTTAFDEHYVYAKTERIYWLCKEKPKVFKSQVLPQYTGDIWTIAPQRGSSHPAPFPQQLAENCILLTTQRGDRVYDPFLGTGTTARAAERLGRVGLGTEIDPEYVRLCEDTTTYHTLFDEEA